MKKFIIPLCFLAAIAACKKNDSISGGNTPVGKVAPDGFTYKTTKPVNVDVTLLSNTNNALKGVMVNVYGYRNGSLGGQVLTGLTDSSGKLNASISVSSYYDTLVVDANTIGVIRNAKVFLTGNALKCTIGGTEGFAGNVAGTFSKLESHAPTVFNTGRGGVGTFNINGTITNTNFVYPIPTLTGATSADALGKPTYLEPTNDTISSDLLANLSYSLPESKALPGSKGQSYLDNSATSDIIMSDTATVWLTFVSEGAGNRNTLGYYTYPTGNPPTKLADITNITYIFPNTSFKGSGGNLTSGNKVKLGNFGKGTTIGFVLFSDGWYSSKGYGYVNTAAKAFFTDAYLNPETLPALKKHTVLLQYKNLLLIGFEDLDRSAASCDQDFNDVVYYVSANPISAIQTANVKPVDVPVDTDGDGVNDVLDAYPNDAKRAYNTYFPSATQYGTLAYEDNWPLQGDYDMNDLVVSYRYKMVLNAKSQLVEIDADFAPIAAGANFQNGFGVKFPFTTATVQSVSGQKLANGYIKLNANGTEAGQTNAVIIPFDGAKQLISNPSGASFVNTDPNQAKVVGDTAHIAIVLTAPITLTDPSTFDPFLISNLRRDYEVHLPGFAPTALANAKLLGTGNDASVPAAGIYYVTKLNYPFAINFADGFNYPVEQAPINTSYLHFFDWTLSGGTNYADWYKNSAAGYQVASKIYSK
ncbi:LruC domain-containing protein [Parasediminibacterium sp. JCM 36343]|uniref:LruC domain-containing protein n=1 Tax=Parasediminibacterium sp. JCM 36343 TaxID=3374279 RepID=UPI00397B8057